MSFFLEKEIHFLLPDDFGKLWIWIKMTKKAFIETRLDDDGFFFLSKFNFQM